MYLQRKEERKATREQPTLREMALGEVIFGQNPVKEAMLQNKRDEFYRLWIQEGDGGSYSSDEKMMPSERVGMYNFVRYETRFKHADGIQISHQGVALDCTPLKWIALRVCWRKMAAGTTRRREGIANILSWLALDEIIDPQISAPFSERRTF